MRRPIKRQPKAAADLKYKSAKVGQFINYLMRDGDKATARKVLYAAFQEIEKNEKQDPLSIFETAIRNTSPTVEVRSRRVGGANYQVPREVRPERQLALSMRWILGAARGKKGTPMHKSLANELALAAKNEGDAVKKKEDTLRMAEANRAFAHFAW